MAGMHCAAADAGLLSSKKLAATADILRQILAPIEADLAALRDRALLLVGFARALRRTELAAIRVEHLDPWERGLRLTLPHSKDERTGGGVTVALPYGTTELCGPGSRRRPGSPWAPSLADQDPAAGRDGLNTPLPRVGATTIDAGTVARIIQARAARAGFDAKVLGGHSLTRGALSTGTDRNIHPTRLKQLGRHETYAVLDEYLELGEPRAGDHLDGRAATLHRASAGGGKHY